MLYRFLSGLRALVFVRDKMAANRVHQLDSVHLQDELADTFVKQMTDCCKYCFYGTLSTFKPELKAAVNILLLHQSLLRHSATFPQAMLGLKYSGSRKRVIVYIALYVFSRWYSDRQELITRLLSTVANLNSILLSRAGAWLDLCLKAFSLVNFLTFLLEGRYPTVLERIAGMKVTLSRPRHVQPPSYELTNQELFWNGFTEFVMCVLPFVNLIVVKNWFNRLMASEYVPQVMRRSVEDVERGVSTCADCGDVPTMPHSAETCRHIFCYYCISANKMADTNYACPVCGEQISRYQSTACNKDKW